MKKIRIYCAGGCGVNIGQQLLESLSAMDDQPMVELALIDTSTANLKKEGEKIFYHIQGDLEHPTDGSGMVRKTNYPAIMRSLPHILSKFPAGDFNILIHSASGGSGSVVGPLLAAKLLEDNKPFTTMLVGSQGCVKEVTNTIDTIESLQAIALKQGKALPCHYFDNAVSPRSHVDGLIGFLVSLWSFLHTDRVTALDRKDIENFLNYDRVTAYPAGLSQLQVWSKQDMPNMAPGVALATLMSLEEEGEHQEVLVDVAYHVTGLVSGENYQAAKLSPSIRIGNFQGTFSGIIKKLKEKVDRFKAEQAAALVNRLDVQGADENGMKL